MEKEYFEEINASDDFLYQLERQIKPQIESYFNYVFESSEIRLKLQYDGYNIEQKKQREKKYITKYEGNISKVTISVYFFGSPIGFELGLAWVDPYYRFEIDPNKFSNDEPILFWIIEPFKNHFLDDIKQIIKNSKTSNDEFGSLNFATKINSLSTDICLMFFLEEDTIVTLKKHLSSIIELWNSNVDAHTSGYNGKIHSIGIEQGFLDNIIISEINLGTSGEIGLQYILKGLSKTELKISQIEISAL